MKESESQKKATRKYIANQYRPSVYFDKDLQEKIEKRYSELGYKSFNQYVNKMVLDDIGNAKRDDSNLVT